ncbi:MAG: long-chain fatty acid--CoA ligase [Gemmatimonadaceae bacterium]|nr:long-chain fatty acid--CoA ligase [Gemmatimonadaceae bacterium]
MHGLMMDMPLSVPMMIRRALTSFSGRPVVHRRPDRAVARTTYGDLIPRAGRLAQALRRLGVRPGDRVATLAWNHARHVEAYFAIPCLGAVLHTLNLRLHPDDIAFIANHAADRVILVDKVLWPLWEKVAGRVKPEHVIVMSDDGDAPPGTLDYEALISGESDAWSWDDVAEHEAAAMCYTSGTTGAPKGVLYSHRSITLHALGLGLVQAFGLSDRDVVLPVVPMFHVNAWGLPFACAFLGSGQVHPGPHLDPASLLGLLQDERVTLTAGVPTIWLGILQALDAAPGTYKLDALHTMVVGGAAVPESVIRAFRERHGLNVVHAWGMTETSPLGTVSRLTPELDTASDDVKYAYRARQGRPMACVEVRARNEEGLVAWDGATMGELEVRGPWVARGYYQLYGTSDRFTSDGWFRTGDVVTIDALGYVTIQDRAKDLVKSGGEWISSVALEGALMGHPDVAEAAVVAIAHPRWDERPLALVVVKEGRSVDEAALRAFLAERFAKWWVPDAIVRVDAIPKTSAGKFHKSVMREQFREHYGSGRPAAGG